MASKQLPAVVLVGRPNVGKSTLFNRLTSGDTLAMDKLFATLDAKSQKIAHTMPLDTVVIDTVGFIRKLPHHLVASFRSTMEEAVAADLNGRGTVDVTFHVTKDASQNITAATADFTVNLSGFA